MIKLTLENNKVKQDLNANYGEVFELNDFSCVGYSSCLHGYVPLTGLLPKCSKPEYDEFLNKNQEKIIHCLETNNEVLSLYPMSKTSLFPLIKYKDAIGDRFKVNDSLGMKLYEDIVTLNDDVYKTKTMFVEYQLGPDGGITIEELIEKYSWVLMHSKILKTIYLSY